VYTLFAHDWRARPVERWHAAVVGGDVPEPPQHDPTGMVVLSRPEFDAAVRDALRSWARPGEFEANPLHRTRLVANGGPSLRDVVLEAVDHLHGERNGSRYHQAVVATFLRGVPTQQAVAHRLGVPFSTYRRHLRRGVELVCEELWRREQSAPSTQAGGERSS
jgi:hypothetical protein